MTRQLLLTLAAAMAQATLASAHDVNALVLEGDLVVGVGNVTALNNLAVNNLGEWLVEVDTNNPDTTADAALIRSGAPWTREGQALALPLGSALGSYDSVNLSDSGHGGFNYTLDGTAGSNDNSGVYWDTSLLIQESQISGAPQFSAGTPYIGFFEARVNNADQVMVMASIDDLAITSSVDRAIVRLDTDGAGNLLAETVLFKEGDLAGSGNFPISDFGTGPHYMDFNNAGQVMYIAKLASGVSGDAAIYIDNTLLAEIGGPSPIAGRAWSSLTSAELSMNNNGGWAIHGSIDGDSATNDLIERNGSKFRQQGDTLADIGGFLFENFGSGPVDIADTGQVLWYGDWDAPTQAIDSGLFVDDELIVQEGVTTVGGVVIDTLRGVQDGYAISDNGRFVIFEAVLLNGVDGVFMIDLAGLGTPYCFGDGSGAACPCSNPGAGGEGCANSSGAGATLVASGSPSVAADDLQLLAGGLLPSQPALLFSGTTQPGGGAGLQFGDGLRCAGGTVLRLGVRVPDANGAATWGPGLSALGAWGGGDLRHFQVWYRDPQGSPCGADFNLSQALSILFEL